MPAPLLVTKLFVPVTRPELVWRPRLKARLNAGLDRKITLVAAPAGFGKTTLVAAWLNSKGDGTPSPFKFAWLSLDQGDNDPARFLAYFIAGLNTIAGLETLGAEALDMLESPQPPAAETVLASVINELAAIPGEILFVLDDYHLIEEQAVNQALTFLIERLPPQVHLVITTREDPLLPLPRWRARGQLADLRAADLRFNSAEAAEFLNRVMGLNLSAVDIAALESRTEGWIAGLQLAALSLQGQTDKSGLIQSFTGSNRLVLDYLIDEVLSRQSEQIQEFLLKTAILNRLSGSLCDALTDSTNGQQVLEGLERANLFIVPLDTERYWYRYHHLFAELLAQRLTITYPDLVAGLHARAASWHEQDGDLAEAIHHAFAGGDIETATRLTEKGALDALERSDFGFILRAVDRLPESALEGAPWLTVYHLWALFLTGQIALGASRLAHADRLVDACEGADEAQKRKMCGYIAGLKVQLAAWQRDNEQIYYFADQVKTYLPADHWIQAYCNMMMGVGYWDRGDLAAATDVFQEAVNIGKANDNRRVPVTGAVYLGHASELAGNLHRAARIFEDAFRFAQHHGRELPVASYLHMDYARVLCEMNDLEAAQQHIERGIQQSQILGDTRIENLGNNIAVRIYLASGEIEKARHAHQESQKFVPSPGIVYDMRGGEYPQLRLWLKQGQFREIEAWLKTHDPKWDSSVNFKTRMTATMLARVRIALARQYPEKASYLLGAQDILAQLLEMAEGYGWGYKVVEILALQALVSDLQDQAEPASTTLDRALTLAEAGGMVRVFVDEGPPMANLLLNAFSRGTATTYIRRLLAAFLKDQLEPRLPAAPSSSNDSLLEPLSERELEVLQFMAQGFSNPEISKKLYLSLNTVKAHSRNIFGKLDVHNRTQAVAKARILGVLREA